MSASRYSCLRKTPNMIAMVKEWKALSEQTHLIDNSIGPNEDFSFQAHRHDQSLLSLLRKKYGCVLIIDDETWDENWSSEFIMNKPFHAKRLRM